MKDERVFITGGAGYLGRNLVQRLYPDNEITIFSRDEAKHYYLKKEFPKIRCIIGDVRNRDLLTRVMKGHSIGVFAASPKQIEAVDQNVDESVQTIIHGALNVRYASECCELTAAAFISTDKSRAATTLYGAMKYVAGEAFIVNAEASATRLSSVIYGNVLNSTGSIIPLIWDAVRRQYSLTLYGEEMTRFVISIDHAVDCILYALERTGYNIVPNLRAHRVKDLFELFAEDFGLQWTFGQPRIGEKMHEQLISPFETSRVSYDAQADMYTIHYKNVDGSVGLSPQGLSSENCCISKDELRSMLAQYNHFKPY